MTITLFINKSNTRDTNSFTMKLHILYEINKCAWIITYFAFMNYRFFLKFFFLISYLLIVFGFIGLKFETMPAAS